MKKSSCFILILTCGLLNRIACQLTYYPWWAGDSAGYTAPYYLWSHHAFSDAGRTPMYPLFLGLVQWLCSSGPAIKLSPFAALVTTCLQNLLGLVTALLVFSILRMLRVGAKIACLAASGFALITAVCRFEEMILTPSLSLFSLMLGAWLFVATMRGIGQGVSWDNVRNLAHIF